MITETQRRALFALREALRLCDEARLILDLGECDDSGMSIVCISTDKVLRNVGVYLDASDVQAILEEHPEQ